MAYAIVFNCYDLLKETAEHSVCCKEKIARAYTACHCIQALALQRRRAILNHEGIQAGQILSEWVLATVLCGIQAQTEPEGGSQKAATGIVFGNNLTEQNRCSN